MNKMQLPSRVTNVLAALKTQGHTMEFEPTAEGDIRVNVRKNGKLKTFFWLLYEREFDMFDCDYKRMCNVVDPRVQKKSAAVLKYLEGIIEY